MDMSYLQSTIFSRKHTPLASTYIRGPHPKSEILPDPPTILRVLNLGWWGQAKIHGHRAQIHLNADPSIPPLVFNRQGQLHRKTFPQALTEDLRRILGLKAGWTAIDAEWVKGTDRVYIFDLLKADDLSLQSLPYQARYERLPRVYRSEWLSTLPIFRTLESCLDILNSPDPLIEGLVFKSPTTVGFQDTGIVRCRKRPL